MVLHSKVEILKRKSPQFIILAVVAVLISYIIFIILSDVSTVFSFTKDVKTTIRSMGYFGVFGLMLLEASSLPIPSEVILPFAGYLISTGQYNLNIIIMIFVSTISAVIGSLVDYFIGLKGTQAITKYQVLGRPIFSEKHLKTVASWFSKYGPAMVFLGRLIPGFRTLISFPAGAVKMSLSKFIVYTLTGCVIWNTLLIYVGYYLGSSWREVANVSHYIIIATVAFIIIVGMLLVLKRKRRKALQNN